VDMGVGEGWDEVLLVLEFAIRKMSGIKGP
jgi:hypothetical protein